MATVSFPNIDPDTVMNFEINPGTILQLLETRPEKGPRLKCFEGSVTRVSPGRSHETSSSRLDLLIFAACQEFGIERESLRSTTWKLPAGFGDTAYEADYAYYIQSGGVATSNPPPDLAVEVVVSHSEKKALRAGALLKIPEIWVLDVTKHRLTFHPLVTRGKAKGAYRTESKSRAFPFLNSADVLKRLDDPATGDMAFHENCRAWARLLKG